MSSIVTFARSQPLRFGSANSAGMPCLPLRRISSCNLEILTLQAFDRGIVATLRKLAIVLCYRATFPSFRTPPTIQYP